jgi:predicted DNA-binding transcriptional regulator YafY
MGRSYSRIERLLEILRTIQGHPGITLDQLRHNTGHSLRNLFRDLATLRKSGYPIEHDKVLGGYRIPRGFFMPPIELTFDEALSMIALMEQLPRDRTIPFLNTASRVVEKIRCQLPSKITDQLTALDGHLRVDMARGMADDSPEKVYTTVRGAIAARRVLRCRYESNKQGRPSDAFDFRPYTLWYCQRAWYAVGKRSDRTEVRFLKLNRFTGVTQTDKPYALPEDFDLTTFLGNAWRMMRDDTTYRVVVRFEQPFAETVSETRWHPTQEEFWNDDQTRVTLRFKVDGLKEILWWVLGYGPGAVVLEPPELRQLVYEHHTEAAKLYEVAGKKKMKMKKLE